MNIAVVGSINMDQTVVTKRIPLKGETVIGSNLKFVPGGKGANQAVAMSRLGAKVSMFGCVGNDENGQKLIANLKENGVDTENVKVSNGTPTGLAIITVGENDNTIVVVAGANACIDKAYIDSVKNKLFKYDMVVLQHEIPLETVHYVIELCQKEGVPTILNPAPARKVPEDIVEKVTYLTPNEHEAAIIFGERRSEEDLLRAYPEKLLITKGGDGVSMGLKTGVILNVPARKSNVVDTTGAGDTLNGAFVVKIASGDCIKESLIFANTAAGLSTEKMGAQGGMPTFEEVKEAMEEQMKKQGIVNSEISRVLSYLGHTDRVCIADCGLPIPDEVERIDVALKWGTPTFIEVLKEIVTDMKIEKIILADEIKTENPKVHSEVLRFFENYETGFKIEIEYVPHSKLKEHTSNCKAVIRTGEITPYANIILQSGCIF